MPANIQSDRCIEADFILHIISICEMLLEGILVEASAFLTVVFAVSHR
jgi:hypothetical protein